MSQFDPTTELPTRQYFFNYLNALISNGQLDTGCLFVVGIERFPQLNHALGYRIADRLLHRIAVRLKEGLPQANIIARFSSHIFVVLFSNMKPEEASLFAERIFQLFSTPFNVYEVNVDVDPIIGLSLYPFDAQEASDLCQKADLALYQAQHSPNKFNQYDKKQDPQLTNKLSLMSELREGLSQNEFEVFYQPKITLATGVTSHVEALIRWNHPTKGEIPLSQFIPLAEQTGHIKKLTSWLLQQTFQQSHIWQSQNRPINIAINLSIEDILNKQMPQIIKAMLQEYHVRPENILFEITERTFMHDQENAIKAIQKICDLGTLFSIDDYGTGYSSLSYLKLLPIHEIKIDQSFIKEINHSSKVKHIVQSTIQLGHSINMQVVAEGIDDQETLKTLQKLQCDLGQGFLFSTALSLGALEVWLKGSTKRLP